MPAEISMINGQAAMAYQNAMPWHRLGTHVEGGIPDVAAALRAANLDWEVTPQPIFVGARDHLSRTRTGALRYKPIEGRRALVRDVDNQVLSVVSADYTVIQNHQAFGVLDDVCREYGVTIETAGALGKHGQRVWMLAKMPETVEPIPGDPIHGYILILTGHDGFTTYTGKLTPIRVVCANTLQTALQQGNDLIRLEHTPSDVQQLEVAKELITKMVEVLHLTSDTYKQMAQKKLAKSEVGYYVEEVLEMTPDIGALMGIDGAKLENVTTRRRDRIVDLTYSGKGADPKYANAWTAYNAVTEYVDHVRPIEWKSQTMVTRSNTSALFGPGAKLKERALELAIAL